MIGAFALLGLAIVIEVGATASLSRAEGFTNPAWTVVVVSGYAASIWLLAIVVRQIPVSIAYAVWSGAGTALVVLVGLAFLGEQLSGGKAFFLSLIIAGVVGLNLVGAH